MGFVLYPETDLWTVSGRVRCFFFLVSSLKRGQRGVKGAPLTEHRLGAATAPPVQGESVFYMRPFGGPPIGPSSEPLFM